MNQRITYANKDRRHDQRRSVLLPGSIDGIQVELTDVGLSGIGGSVRNTSDAANLSADGDETARLEFATGAGQQIAVEITIEWLDLYTGAFGASFVKLTNKQFDAIENLMFPRRAKL